MSTPYGSGRYSSIKIDSEEKKSRSCLPKISPFHFQFMRLKIINVRNELVHFLFSPRHFNQEAEKSKMMAQMKDNGRSDFGYNNIIEKDIIMVLCK